MAKGTKQDVAQKAKAPLAERFLESRAVQFISENRILITAFPYFALRMFQLFFLQPNQDVKRYYDTATAWMQGKIPYAQFQLEYPPGGLLLFELPRQLTDDFNRYSALFAMEMLLFDLAILVLLWKLPAAIAGRSATTKDTVRRYDGTVAVWLYMAFTVVLGSLQFERYDTACSFLFLIWLHQVLTNKRRWVPDLIMAVGIWVKLVSVLFLPVYLAYLCATDCGPMVGTFKDNLKKYGQWFAKEGITRVGFVVGFTLALFLKFYYDAGDSLFSFIEYHKARGVQIESTYSSLVLLAHQYIGEPLRTQHVYGCTEIVHALSRQLADTSVILTLGSIAAISALYIPRILRSNDETDRNLMVLESMTALLIAFISFSKVFSPQYMLWVAPFVPLLLLRQEPRNRTQVLGFSVVFLITALILLFYYVNLIYLQPFPTWLLVTRNFLMVALGVSILRLPPIQWFEAGTGAKVKKVIGDLLGHPYLPWFALFLAAFWVFLANLSETTANDIWIQLRTGEEIVKSKMMPYTETYSAVVYGRNFIAHEWLSGVLFYFVTWLMGDGGISFLTAGVALVCFLLMYFAFPPEERKKFYFLPLLLWMNYLVAFRLLARPHIFTIDAQACLLLAIERWKRTGKMKDLAWLVPVQLVWINLHGAALFGPSFIAMMGGCVWFLTMFPALQERGAVERRFTGKDVKQLGIVAALLALACIVNPYGTKIVTFSVDLLNNDYAKNRVWEWTSPFLPSNLNYYWLWLFVGCMVTLWVSIIIRLPTLPVIDFAVAVLVTYLGFRANRFVPDVAIFSFPIIVRSLKHVMDFALKTERTVQRPWVEIGIVTLLLTNCVVYGYAHSAREHRPLPGYGFGGDMPYTETDLLKKLKVKGTIFNEYSDGALIINRLVPDIRPVLDSRIDLYPIDLVEEYDRAYMYPQLFKMYIDKHKVNVVLLYRNRASPAVVQWLDNNGEWERVLTTQGRYLWLKKGWRQGETAGLSLRGSSREARQDQPEFGRAAPVRLD